ncbi:HIT family protein [Schleiferilactobacillus harbinensis]|jgi:histidine triad (HIT) family protein|uniref:HIT family protein n=1 Tax=Schleiferilactobacillus harbinensis TaxID=304207 RepID=UPI0007B81D06|nr:HIT family protein [Schleiferilactobacillus harbinensis]
MTNCIFCQIIAGVLPSYRIAENKQAIAFLATARDMDGHILVVPRQHIQSILDCDDATLAAVMQLTRQISVHLVQACGYAGVNLLNASGTSAGQSVLHFHIHILPRRTGDGINAWPALPGATEDLATIAQRIRLN